MAFKPPGRGIASSTPTGMWWLLAAVEGSLVTSLLGRNSAMFSFCVLRFFFLLYFKKHTRRVCLVAYKGTCTRDMPTHITQSHYSSVQCKREALRHLIQPEDNRSQLNGAAGRHFLLTKNTVPDGTHCPVWNLDCARRISRSVLES